VFGTPTENPIYELAVAATGIENKRAWRGAAVQKETVNHQVYRLAWRWNKTLHPSSRLAPPRPTSFMLDANARCKCCRLERQNSTGYHPGKSFVLWIKPKRRKH